MSAIHRVLILRTDRLSAEILRDVTLKVLPSTEVALVRCAATARCFLAEQPAQLLITGFDPALEGDVLGLLTAERSRSHASRVFVVTGHEETRLLTHLPSMAVDGVFDALEGDPGQLENALRTVAAGGRYWSSSVQQRINSYQTGSRAADKTLTPMEQLVLSVVGDGSDDTTAADVLGLRPATVATIRRNLHRKLNVQHRGDLVRYAAQHGYVRFTNAGIVRPGFSLLTAACRSPKVCRVRAVELLTAAGALATTVKF